MFNSTHALIVGGKEVKEDKSPLKAKPGSAFQCEWPHGTLFRKSAHLGQWSQRFYILRERKLLYFEAQPTGDDIFARPLGVIFLDGCTVASASTSSDPYLFVISNTARDFQYYLRAKNLVDLNSWIMAIEKELQESTRAASLYRCATHTALLLLFARR